MSWIPLVLAVAAALCDLRWREIPNRIPVAITMSAIVAWMAGWLPGSGWSLIGGVALGLTLSGLLYSRGAWGGGDVKLLASLGAWLGPVGLLSTCFWMAMVGLLLSIVAVTRGHRDMAYAPAIAGGLLIHCLWPQLLSNLASGLSI